MFHLVVYVDVDFTELFYCFSILWRFPVFVAVIVVSSILLVSQMFVSMWSVIFRVRYVELPFASAM